MSAFYGIDVEGLCKEFKKRGAVEELERLIHYDSNMEIDLGVDAVEFIAKRLKELKEGNKK